MLTSRPVPACAVIAPLTTLGHWQREIETWTDMNCVVYAGGQDDRRVIEVRCALGCMLCGVPGPCLAALMQKRDWFHGPPRLHVCTTCLSEQLPFLPDFQSFMAQKYDLFHGPPGRRHSVKPNVVLSSYETVLKERGLFQVR